MSDPSDRSAFRSGPVLLALFSATFFSAVGRGGRFYVLDFHQTFEPLRRILGRELRHGSLLWDGSLSNGAPLLANPLHGTLYPPNLLFAVLAPDQALTLLTALHLLFGALGAWYVARRWGLGAPAAWGAAAVFGFNGVFVSATPFANLAWSQAWLPWLVLGWSAVVSGDAPRGARRFAAPAALAVVVAALLTLGEPFVLLAGALGLSLLIVAEVTQAPTGLRSIAAKRCLLRPLVALIPALVLASPFLVAALRYLPASVRGHGFVPEGLVYWSFHPALSLGLLYPGVFGDPDLDGLASFWAPALIPEKGFSLFRGFYVGGVPLAFALVGVAGRGRRRALAVWLALLVLLGLGRYTPLYGWISGLPLLDSMRYPMKWLLPATLPLALLAGFGIDALADPLNVERMRRAAFGVVLALLGLTAALSVAASPGLDGWLLAWAGNVDLPGSGLNRLIRSTFLGGLLRGAAPLAAALAILFAMRRGAWAWRMPHAIVALILVDLWLANPRLAPVVPGEFYRRTPPAVRILEEQAAHRGRVYVEGPMFAEVILDDPPESSIERARWEHETLVGYIGATQDLDLAFNMDVGLFRTMRYAKLESMLRSAPAREKLMLLGAAGVTHLVTYDELQHPRLELLAILGGRSRRPQRVTRNELARPRVRTVETLLVYEDDQAFMLAVRDHPDDLFARVALVRREELTDHGIDPDSLPAPRFDVEPARLGTATVLEERGGLLRVETDGGAGFLVVSDSMAPGWRATVDGVDAALLVADYAFRAVPVPAGRHEVAMRYRPWW